MYNANCHRYNFIAYVLKALNVEPMNDVKQQKHIKSLGRKGIGRRMLNFFIAIDKEKINVVN
jgi:hypothetical protein